MEHLSRDQYIQRLGKLNYKVNPSLSDLTDVCPHLESDLVASIFTAHGEKDYANIALPPVLIRHSYRTAWLYSGSKTDPENAKTSLSAGGCSRTLASYVDGKPHGDVFIDTSYMEEAMRYAEEHWGDSLIMDNWQDVIEIYVQDPTELTDKGSPRTKALISFGIDDSFNRISNDHSKPEYELLNEHIVIATLDKLEREEIKGGRGTYTEFNCAHCSAGLSLNHCDGCGHKFKDDHFRCGWCTPLPDKLIDLLVKAGHQFGVDPLLGRRQQVNWIEEERKRWALR